MNIGKIIKARRQALGISAEDLSAKIGVSPVTIYRYESQSISNMRIDKLHAIAKALHTTPAYLMGWDHTSESEGCTAVVRIPILGSIPAGIPIEAAQDILGWEDLPSSMVKTGTQYFALRIKGDSMSPNYLDGDILIFRRQSTCLSGQDCAVMVNSEDATFKRVKISSKGITLQPLNPAYDPLYYPFGKYGEEPVKILGTVFELRRRF